ncbi:DUF222 domain-containing protein [Microbacterium sp.]|uniref:HNH endonuclease signature motif containing protein n=1 Tax=Microbacterium sp. TaxID=51671 RepID=UPI0039E3A926
MSNSAASRPAPAAPVVSDAGWCEIEADPERFWDEATALRAGVDLPSEPDPWASGEVHDDWVDRLQDVTRRGRALIADQYAMIAAVLRDAAECPDPWIGPDPTLDPTWVDPQERSVARLRRERSDIAVRAATADLAVRIRLSETMIRTRAAHADILQERCPRLWLAFTAGDIDERNAVATALLAASLPDDRPDSWAAFDDAVAGPAQTLPPGKLRIYARALRERVHAESVTERHRRARNDRGVWLTPELDGMASVTIMSSAADVYAMYGQTDATARHLRQHEGETRTLAQLRADVLIDLVNAGATASAALDAPTGAAACTCATRPARPQPAVAITVPVMTLLGQGDEPATLDGYGPIDLDTARRLAGQASSWVRILTHPVTGTVLDLDRRTYRVPKALRRWLGVRDPVCIFPGCSRPARTCQLDHRLDWQYGGTTTDANLAPQCEPHHVLKTKSLWRPYRCPVTGATWWISPTAEVVEADPPPW